MPPDREQTLLDKIASLHAKVAELSALNEQLQQAVDALSRRIYGKSSEKLDPAQLEFVLGQLARPATPPPSAAPEGLQPTTRAARSKKQRRQRIPENLPVTIQTIDPPAVIANPEAFRRTGEEVTERIGFTPGSFWVIRQVRGRYVAIDNPAAKPIIAPLPACLLELFVKSG